MWSSRVESVGERTEKLEEGDASVQSIRHRPHPTNHSPVPVPSLFPRTTTTTTTPANEQSTINAASVVESHGRPSTCTSALR